MNNFFITGISKRKKAKLVAAGIHHVEMEIDGKKGLVFEQDYIINCLRVLKLDIESKSDTSIPGIIKAKTVVSDTVTFNLTETAEPAALEVVISAPEGHTNRDWELFLKKIKEWAQSHLGSLHKKVIIHEGCRSSPDFTALENELHVILGCHLGSEGARLSKDWIEYYPAGRILCFKGLGSYPGTTEYEKIIENIGMYLPIVLASTAETVAEAQALLPYDVVFKNWEGGLRQDRVEKIIQKVLPKTIYKGIIIDVPHSEIMPLVTNNDEFLHIHIWSAPSGQRMNEPASQMWGYNVSKRDTSFAPTETGIVISESEGWPVAEIIGNNLYIFHDACHYDYEEDYKIFEKIMEEAGRIISLSPEEKSALVNAPRVVLQGSFSNPAKIKKETEETLLPVLARKIVIINGNGKTNAPLNNGLFHIWLNSSPAGQCVDSPRLPAKIFGFDTNNGCSWAYFQPTETGIEILNKENLFSLAELFDDNLYIHIPLDNTDMPGGLDIYRRILESTLLEITKTPEEKADRDKAIKKIRQQRTLANYVALCQKRQKIAINETNRKLSETSSAIKSSQKALVESIRQEKELQHSLKCLQDLQSSAGDEFKAEYGKIFEIEGVEGVIAKENKLLVNTYPIYITTQDNSGKDVTFDIGKFCIEISVDGSNGGIRFFNSTRQSSGNDFNIHHPHVNRDGYPCLGNIREMIAQLIAEYQFAALISLAIQYLETVNLDDSVGEKIFKYWPVVEK